MTDLFKKLNVLVQSAVHDALGDESSRNTPSAAKLGKGIEGEIKQLRQSINSALSYEDDLQQRVQSLQAEVARLNQQADDFVAANNDNSARYTIEQLQRAQQRLSVAESDLREHQLVTQELITRVNTLEAAVADARRAESANQADQAQSAATPGQALSDVLRNVRERITAVGSAPEDPDTQVEETPLPEQPVEDQAAVEDDLAQRRQRLSKPEK